MAGLRNEAFGQMSRLASVLAEKHFEFQTIIEEGLPWERIVEKSQGFDLIVLGKQAARRAKIFSQQTVRRVMQDAACPVVVVSGLSTAPPTTIQ
jgi:nucleotide-binding universal stress UspA family protein